MTTHSIKRSFVLSVILSALTFFGSGAGHAVDFELTSKFLEEGRLRLGEGQEVELDVVIDNGLQDFSASIQGFQMAIGHDSSVLDFVEGTWKGTALDTSDLRNGEGPEFYAVRDIPGEGVTIAAVFDLQNLNAFLLGGLREHVVTKLRYLGAGESGGAATDLGFVSSLGDPPIENKYETFAGDVLAPDSSDQIGVIVGGEVIYSIHFDRSAVSASTNQSFNVGIRLANNPLEVTGFSFGVSYDGSILQRVGDLAAGSDRSAVLDVPLDQHDFYAFNEVSSGGEVAGFTVGLALGFPDGQSGGSLGVLPPSAEGHDIFDLTLRPKGSAGTTTVLKIAGDLGSPAVPVGLDINGITQLPERSGQLVPVSVAVTVATGNAQGADFLRGDVNQSGSLNITDAINSVLFQFVPSEVPQVVRDTGAGCRGAFDFDADDVLGVTDVFLLLNFLFATGPRPAAPYPDCGQPGPDVDPAFFCSSYSCQ